MNGYLILLAEAEVQPEHNLAADSSFFDRCTKYHTSVRAIPQYFKTDIVCNCEYLAKTPSVILPSKMSQNPSSLYQSARTVPSLPLASKQLPLR